jgi:Ni/Co efflux regulator RcnB
MLSLSTKETLMKNLFAAAAAACLLAGTPALAEHHDHGGGGAHVTHTTTVHTSTMGGSHESRTVRTTHVNVIRGGYGHSRTITHVTSTRHFGRGGMAGGSHAAMNMRSYRRNFTATHRYHFGVYVRPHGWYSHRWVYGERLPYGWYGRDYWISDYGTFGLMGPPDGYQWVRYGDDALLIDVDTGEVLQVEYGVFY